MSLTVAVAIMVVVILVVGGVGYAVLSTLSSSPTQTVTRCSPPTSSACTLPTGLNDVVLFIPYGTMGAVTNFPQGQSLPATVTVSGGENASQYSVNWGDGSTYTGANSTSNHVYAQLGSYVISAEALVESTWHTGWDYLYPIHVIPNAPTTSSGWYPTIVTGLSNGSVGQPQFGWLEGSGDVTVSARYASLPTAAGYTAAAPSLRSTGGTESDYVPTATGVSASYSFSTAGIYYITMVGSIAAPGGTIYQNYTWTVVVSPPGVRVGCGQGCSGIPLASPHPGLIVFQEVAPGGATSEDPAVAYDTISAEPILNVYQTLVTYDGSSTASFVPQLSLCVPGPGCAATYGGNTLIVNNASTGSPEYFTFPIDPAARFYDPATGANWSVYPSDVAFTIARTCGFADLPGVGAQPGWIECQALLPNGNPRWDSAIHYSYNNTPQKVLGSMQINNTTYCPKAVMDASNGCITFNAWGGGASWPFFLELVADPLGASVEPCSWFTYHISGVPGFPGTRLANGDGPCFLPGNATNTSQTSFTTWLSNTPSTYWDNFELLTLDTPEIQPNVRWSMVGSGPYYVINQPFQQSVGYTLAQNPAYQAPTGCKGEPYCEPLPGATHYVANVTVVYQSTDRVGILGYRNGTTDFATILPGETPEMLSLIQESKIGAFAVPTLNIVALAFALEFSPTAAKSLDPNVLNVPEDFFNYVGLREFLVNAFPYNTVENTIFTTDGIQYGSNYGGAIPQYMGNYYPTNISWPSTDPVSNPAINGSAAWWWAQATTPSSPYYDPELASCMAASPCQFPLIGDHVVPVPGPGTQDYLANISSISGGRLAPNTFVACPVGCPLVVGSLQAQPGQSALPFFNLGWAPDYPDPTDYAAPFYYVNATFTASDAVEQGLNLFDCSQAGVPAPYANDMAALIYWANQPGIPQACQGNAYNAMAWGMNQAAGVAVGPARVLMYNLVEHIVNHLALYVYVDQENTITTYAPWIDPGTINTNPVIGAGGENTWYLCGGNSVAE